MKNNIKNKLQQIAKNKFFRRGIYLAGANFLIGLFNYFFNTSSARLLGPADYSQITTLFSYLAVFSAPLSIIQSVIIQKIGLARRKNTDLPRRLESWILKQSRPFLFLSLFCLPLLPYLPSLIGLSPLPAYTLAALFFLSFFSNLYDSFLQALHLFLIYALISTTSGAFKLAGPFFGRRTPRPLSIILLFILFSYLLRTLLSRLAFKQKTTASSKKEKTSFFKNLKTLFIDRQVRLAVVSHLGLTLFGNLDIIYVKKAFPAHTAGLYGAWSLLAKLLIYLLGPLTSLAYIFFSNQKKQNKKQQTLPAFLTFFLVIGLLQTALYYFWGDFIINFFFGPQFDRLLPLLGLAGLWGIIYLLITYLNNFFLARQSKKILILTLLLPFYIFLLFFTPQEIKSIIYLNLAFGIFILFLQLIAHLRLLKHLL